MESAAPLNAVFTDFDYDLAPLIAELPEGWADNSWRNDACPSAVLKDHRGEKYLTLWFDYRDASLSELMDCRNEGKCHVFCLNDGTGDIWFQSNDWTEMRDYIRAHDAEIRAFHNS